MCVQYPYCTWIHVSPCLQRKSSNGLLEEATCYSSTPTDITLNTFQITCLLLVLEEAYVVADHTCTHGMHYAIDVTVIFSTRTLWERYFETQVENFLATHLCERSVLLCFSLLFNSCTLMSISTRRCNKNIRTTMEKLM